MRAMTINESVENSKLYKYFQQISMDHNLKIKIYNDYDIDIMFYPIGSIGYDDKDSVIRCSISNDNYKLDKRNFLIILTIYVDEKYRRKGIYTKILNTLTNYANSIGLNGLISLPSNDGDFGRSEDANYVWEKLANNQNNVDKIFNFNEDTNEDEIIYIMSFEPI